MKKKTVGSIPKLTRFIVEGEGEFDANRLPSCVSRAVDVAKSLAKRKLIRTPTMATRVGISVGRLNIFSNHPALAPYRLLVRKVAYFGNPKTITEARARLSL